MDRGWSTIPVIFKELQHTLPLTVQFLTLLPTHRIHPILRHTFGNVICGRGDLEKNEKYINITRDIAAQFPTIKHFRSGGVIEAMTRAVKDDRLKPIIFVYALTEVSGRSAFTQSDNNILVAIRFELNELDAKVIQHYLLDLVVDLIDWEWKDRALRCMKLLDAGFAFSYKQWECIWLVMASKTVSYKEEVIRLIKRRRRLWQSVEEMKHNCDSAPFDLAVFVTLLLQLDFKLDNIEQEEWFIDIRKSCGLEDIEVWPTTDVCRFIFAGISTFGTKAMVGYFLTTRQKQQINDPTFMIDKVKPKDLVHSLILNL